MAMTREQQRAIAMASARLRLRRKVAVNAMSPAPEPPPEPSASRAYQAILGGLKGASQIGNTIISAAGDPTRVAYDMADQPWVSPEMRQAMLGTIPAARETDRQHRQAATNALVTMGADPTSLPFIGGQIATEVAGTAAIPFGGAKARLPIRMLRSGAGGAAAAGMVDPSQADVGAMIGAAIPVLGVPLAAAARAGVRGMNKLNSLLGGTYGFDQAAQIARRAVIDPKSVPQLIAALRASGTDIHAGQATAGITEPMWQALIHGALQRNPRFLSLLTEGQQAAGEAALSNAAGGATREAVRNSADLSKDAVNNALIPVLKREIAAANTAGEMLPRMTADASALRAAASNKVTDVGRFTAAGERANEASKTWRPSTSEGNFGDTWSTSHAPTNLPLPLRKYTYPGELAQRAEQVAQKSADDSLLYGEAARFKEAAIASLEAHELKPLKSEAITGRIDAMLRDPRIGPDPEVANALTNIRSGIEQWTNANGIIDGWALETIRKKGVNAVVTQLLGTAGRKEQRSLAAAVTSKINPLIRQVMEDAGGKDYGAYLDAYSNAMRQIAERKLAGKALELFKKPNKDAFINLVHGDNEKAVEKIFGPGQYRIAQEVGDRTMETLRNQAAVAIRDRAVKKQVGEGQQALAELLGQELSRFRLPSYLSVIASSTNKALDAIEMRLNKATKDALTRAFQTPEGAARLLERLPANERNAVLKVITDPALWASLQRGATRVATVGTASVRSSDRPMNAYAQQRQD